MSNSPLVTYTKLSPYAGSRYGCAIERITPHCVVGQCSVEALGAEFSGTKKKSSNYGIDKDGRVGMFVPEDRRAVTSSSSANDSRSVTIECASDIEGPQAFRPVVYDRLIELCADVCRRNGKTTLRWIPDRAAALAYAPAEDEMLLTVHRWFAATGCPGDWLMARMDELAARVTAALQPPKEGGEPMHEYDNGDGGVIFEPVGADAPGGPKQPWYTEAMAWAEERGLIRDGRPADNLTRAELATVLMRYDALQADRDKALLAAVEKTLAAYIPEDEKPSGLLADD